MLWLARGRAEPVDRVGRGAYPANVGVAGFKPFREVAQDETHTIAELCKMQEESRRENRW